MAKTKLNQIVALNAPKKADFQKMITKYYHLLQKSEPFFGLERKYTPKDDNGEQLPPESSKVQLKVKELLHELKIPWQNMFDVVLTNDVGNSQAKANIVVDDKVIANDVPITTLLFLDKQLNDWKDILSKIPVLPLSDEWNLDDGSGLYSTPIIQRNSTKKVKKAIVLYDATDKHPAQTQLIDEDITVGCWMQKKLSSALPITEVEGLLNKLSKLRDAVIKAREEANSIEIEQQKKGEAILSYLFD